MEEIQVGEFVRTKKQGIKRIDTIFQNKTVNKYGYEIGSEWDGKLYSIIKTTDVLKHSFNLIDLIEEGDYVNGAYVTSIYEQFGKKYIDTEVEQNYGFINAVPENEVKSIVTHEQFASLEYKVEEG